MNLKTIKKYLIFDAEGWRKDIERQQADTTVMTTKEKFKALLIIYAYIAQFIILGVLFVTTLIVLALFYLQVK